MRGCTYGDSLGEFGKHLHLLHADDTPEDGAIRLQGGLTVLPVDAAFCSGKQGCHQRLLVGQRAVDHSIADFAGLLSNLGDGPLCVLDGHELNESLGGHSVGAVDEDVDGLISIIQDPAGAHQDKDLVAGGPLRNLRR